MNTLDDLAHQKLRSWEHILNEELEQYPYSLKEWHILEDIRLFGQDFTNSLFRYSYHYPMVHELLTNCIRYIQCDFQQVFPDATQMTVNKLGKMALDLLLHPDDQLLEFSFVSLAERFTAPRPVCCYYREAEKAFKACAFILARYGVKSNEAKKALNLAAHINAKADMTSAPAIDKLLLLAEYTEATVIKIRELYLIDRIKKQETFVFELKETLSYDVKTRMITKRQQIENSALKAVASFLNTEGGILLIGVSDRKDLRGLHHDLAMFYGNSYDKLMLYWQDILIHKLHKHTKLFVKSELLELDSVKVLCVECDPANKPTYLSNRFYIRQYGRCDELKDDELKLYLKTRFNLLS